jgi:hypothetical protein
MVREQSLLITSESIKWLSKGVVTKEVEWQQICAALQLSIWDA